MATEAIVLYLIYANKSSAFEYLYLGGMRWDPLGRLEDDEIKSEVEGEDASGDDGWDLF